MVVENRLARPAEFSDADHMKRLLVVSLLMLASTGHAPPAGALETGEIMPDWTLGDAAGRSVDFRQDSAGSASVVLFWMTTCPYCRALMPNLQKLADEFRGRSVKFYALNVWETGDPVAYLEKNGLSFRLLLDADAVARANDVKGTPGLFVVDAEGRVIYQRQSGEDELDVEIGVREALESALN